MELEFGVSSLKRERGNLPELPVVNMFVEQAMTEPKQVALQSRPGLVDNGVTSGAGPVKQVFQKDGVLGGDLFTVSAGNLYRAGVLIGAIGGSGHVSMAGNEIGLAINAGAEVYFYNGTTLGVADFPDSAAVCKIIEVGGRFFAIRSGTQKYYWTNVLETGLVAGVLTFGALAFASAESEPDQLVDMLAIDDRLILGGKETVEFHAETGDNLLPYTPIEGMTYDKGIRATGCLQPFDNSFLFISGDGLVYRGANAPERVSDNGIEERLSGSATASLFTWFHEGHEHATLRGDDFSMNYDAQTRSWWEAQSEGETNWICQCAVPGPVFGSAIDGKTLAFGNVHTDLDGPMIRQFRAGFALSGDTVTVDNLRLRTNPGNTPYLTGQYADPVVEMAFSRDAGREFGAARPAKMGAKGRYRQMVEWRALGTFDAPGGLFDFRCSDPVPFRVSGVAINEDGGGRSR